MAHSLTLQRGRPSSYHRDSRLFDPTRRHERGNQVAVRSLRDLYDEFRAANGIRDNRPAKILDEVEEVLRVMDESEMEDIAE
jgi:hypothetical protein